MQTLFEWAVAIVVGAALVCFAVTAAIRVAMGGKRFAVPQVRDRVANSYACNAMSECVSERGSIDPSHGADVDADARESARAMRVIQYTSVSWNHEGYWEGSRYHSLGVCHDNEPIRDAIVSVSESDLCSDGPSDHAGKGIGFITYTDTFVRGIRTTVSTMIMQRDREKEEERLMWMPSSYKQSREESRRGRLLRPIADMDHVEGIVDDGYRELNSGAASVSGLLEIDRHSIAAQKHLATAMALGAKEALRSLDGPKGFLTVNLAACPALEEWLHAGRQHPDAMCREFWSYLYKCATELGAAFVYIDGWFELSMNSTYDESSRHGTFIKDWIAKHGGSMFRRNGWLGRPIFVPHYHVLIAMVDQSGRVMDLGPLAEALRDRYTAKRQVVLLQVDESKDGGLDGAVERISAYSIIDVEESQALLAERVRWKDALDTELLVSFGWRQLQACRLWTNKAVFASVVARDRLRDAIVNFDIGPSLIRCYRIAMPTVTTTSDGERRTAVVLALDDFRVRGGGYRTRRRMDDVCTEPIVRRAA